MTGKKGDARILVRAEGLHAGYGAGDVLKGVSLEIAENERVAVIGPNGSGETTLLRALAGALPYRGSLSQTITDPLSPRLGEATERSSLSGKEAARETGLLTQHASSWFPYPVLDSVMLGRYARQKASLFSGPSQADVEAVSRALSACDVAGLSGSRVDELSGGQLQRVNLARVIAQDPAVLLLDEPTNHLDLRYQLELVDLIRAWAGGPNKASIGVFHDLSLALRFADRILLLDGGTVARAGDPREVIESPETARAYGIDVAKAMRSLLQSWEI
jgi:iron complex transport system ATP-binding protein